MERKKLSRVYMKGRFMPGLILAIIGFIHMRFNMIEKEGNQYFLTKSPYLLKIKHYYLEYTRRMHMKTSELIHPLQRKLLEKMTERTVLQNRQEELERKENMLPKEPKSGNEIRALISLQKEKSANIEALAGTAALIDEYERQIDEIRKHEQLSIERMLEIAISKSYSYIEGCQRAGKTKSFYAGKEDHDEQLFQFITDSGAIV